MLVEILGASGSDKAWLGLRLSAELIELDIPVTYLPPVAPAFFRRQAKMNYPNDHVSVMQEQLKAESTERDQIPTGTIAVCGGSPVNSLFFLKNGHRDDAQRLLKQLGYFKLRPLVLAVGIYSETSWLRENGLWVIELPPKRADRLREARWSILDYMSFGG